MTDAWKVNIPFQPRVVVVVEIDLAVPRQMEDFTVTIEVLPAAEADQKGERGLLTIGV